MSDRDGMSDGSEYSVISFTPRPAMVSLLCSVLPLCFGMLADDLPYAFEGRLRGYYGHIFLGAISFCALGIVLGIIGLRQPEQRGTARIGLLINSLVLVLLVLFLLIFQWIRRGQWTWFQ